MAADKADKKAVCPKHGVPGTSKQQPPVGQRAANAVKLCPKCNNMGFYTGCPVCGRGGNVIGVPLPVAPPYPGAVIVTMADGSRAWVDSKTATAMRHQANQGQALGDVGTVVGDGTGHLSTIAGDRSVVATRAAEKILEGEGTVAYKTLMGSFRLAEAARLAGMARVLNPVGAVVTGAQVFYDLHQTLTAPHDPRDAAPYSPAQDQQFQSSNPTNILGQGTSRQIPQSKGPVKP